MLQFYVLSLLYTEDRRRVLLCRRNRPKWQAGRLNGMGGKIEVQEPHYQAHIREFCEETGMERLECLSIDWHMFSTLSSNDWIMYCYRGFSNRVLDLVPGKELDQPTLLYHVNKAHKDPSLLPNLPWLIMMGLMDDPMFTQYAVGCESTCYAHHST